MTLYVLAGVLYNISFYGSIITLIASLIILIFKLEIFKGIGKNLCRVFIITWILYLGLSIFTMVTINSKTNEITEKTSWNISHKVNIDV